jgi:hypothetical protein
MSTSKRTRSSSPAPSDSKKARSLRPVRFLIFSDTHDAELPSNLPACDVLLHCGDLTEDGTPDAISKALTSIGSIEAELKLAIAGNHEISLDKAYYLAEGGSAEHVAVSLALIPSSPTSVAAQHGITFLREGTHTFALSSGASFTLYASPFTPGSGTSAFQYPSNEDRYNSASDTPAWAMNVGTERTRIPNHVDIVMTHGPAQYVLDDTGDGRSAGCEHLRRAIVRVKPKLFCFGHVHRGYGAQILEFSEKGDEIVPAAKEWVGKNQAKKKGYAGLPPGSVEKLRDGRQTLAVNAATEGEKGVLENASWLVELAL